MILPKIDRFIHVLESECNYLKSGQIVGLIFFQNSIYYLISAFFSWYDNKNEKTQTLSIKRLVNPGRRPLKKVEWDLVRLANHISFLNGHLSGIVYCIVYLQGYRFRGCCDSIFAENINTYVLNKNTLPCTVYSIHSFFFFVFIRFIFNSVLILF